MPRLPKWLLLKEWLTYEDVLKILDNSATELENILARDESEEFGYSYKFICTFAPRDCQKEIKEYRFEQTARQSMRAHLKEHIKILKSDFSSDKDSEFLTRNQLFQQSKAHKHKLLVNKNEVPSKRSKASPKSDDMTSNLKEPNKKKSKPKTQRKKTQFTEIKQASVDRENIEQLPSSTFKEEFNDVSEVLAPAAETVNISNCSELKEVFTSDVKMELADLGLVDQGHETEVDDDDDSSDKISCETQTDHRKKEMETAQYRIATKLFAIDRTQWGNIEKALDELIMMENASEEIMEDDKLRILEAMNQWMDSVRLYNRRATESLQDALTTAEESVLDSLGPEDWKRLDAADDPESKLRLTVYARMLLRDYVWYPRKFKPKVCRHCQRQYTASTSLYSHLVSLSGIRFWVCSKCKDANRDEATFTRKHSLQYHILKEVGIPRYRCSQPGCSKTHNHTHHQKSHARQHTGEQYYKCEVPGCKVRFSNRNTYSRHLLQNHSTELTSANQLRAIDKSEAQMKVYAARLRARERSKCKRQQSHDCDFKEQEGDKQAMQDRSLNQMVVNEARYAESDVPANLEKLMRPSASQLLYGIARDVRKTTSTMEGIGKPTDKMLGGLNLLATVSKYMNAENCELHQWKSDYEKEKALLAQSKNEPHANDTFNDTKLRHNDQSSPSAANVSAVSNFPSLSSYTQVSSCHGDGKSKLSSPHVVTVASQHKLPLSAFSHESKCMPSSAKSITNNISSTSTCALNMQLLGKKVILRPSSVISAVSSPQVHTVISPSSGAIVKSNNLKERSSGKLLLNVSQSQELKSNPTFSNLKAKPSGSTNKAAVTSTPQKIETTNKKGTTQGTKDENDSAPSDGASPNSPLHLRSISCVSGKTYIVLASPEEKKKLEALKKESDSRANSKLVAETAVPLS